MRSEAEMDIDWLLDDAREHGDVKPTSRADSHRDGGRGATRVTRCPKCDRVGCKEHSMDNGINVTFGDGTDIDTWTNVFGGLRGYTLRLTLDDGRTQDVQFIDVRQLSGGVAFAYHHVYPNGEPSTATGLRYVESIKGIHVY